MDNTQEQDIEYEKEFRLWLKNNDSYFAPHEILLFLGGPNPYFKCLKCKMKSEWFGPCTKELLFEAFKRIQDNHLKAAIDKEFSFW